MGGTHLGRVPEADRIHVKVLIGEGLMNFVRIALDTNQLSGLRYFIRISALFEREMFHQYCLRQNLLQFFLKGTPG